MIYGFGQVPNVDFISVPSVLAYKVAKVFSWLALVAIVMSILVKNPTAFKSKLVLAHEDSGLLKITHHPAQWWVLLFARAHILANDDSAPIVFFGTFALLSFFGVLSMDQKRSWETDPK